jgi:tRNA(fMet)-specific endonuclease VapC
MEKYLLDSNICIYLLKGKYNLDKKLKKIGLQNCCISEVTLAELKYGAECSNRIDENMKMIENFAEELAIVPIFNSLNVYAREKARLRKAGELIDDFDILIGATAVANNMILVTENEKHLKRISNVVIENWIKK